MAFVRWRGNCAQLLTTIYEGGKSRQVLLANLHSGYSIGDRIRKDGARRFPNLTVDWRKAEESLAQGPPGTPALTPQQWDYLRAEQALRQWAAGPHIMPCDVGTLKAAAHVLSTMRAQTERA